MFSFFKKNDVKKLKKQYEQLMAEAMHVQRSGDLRSYAKKIEEAESVLKKIKEIKQ